MFEDTEVGDLPDCNTSQMLEALDGHLSLVHSNYAPEADDEKSSTEDNDGGSQDQVFDEASFDERIQIQIQITGVNSKLRHLIMEEE